MRFVPIAALAFVVACGETSEDRNAALQAAANQPVPVYQSSSDGVDRRGRPLRSRGIIEEYLSAKRTQTVGTQRAVPFVAAEKYGQLYRIDGPSGMIAVFGLSDILLAGIGPNPQEQMAEMAPKIAARAGCAWAGDAAVQSTQTAVNVIVFLDC